MFNFFKKKFWVVKKDGNLNIVYQWLNPNDPGVEYFRTPTKLIDGPFLDREKAVDALDFWIENNKHFEDKIKTKIV